MRGRSSYLSGNNPRIISGYYDFLTEIPNWWLDPPHLLHHILGVCPKNHFLLSIIAQPTSPAATRIVKGNGGDSFVVDGSRERGVVTGDAVRNVVGGVVSVAIGVGGNDSRMTKVEDAVSSLVIPDTFMI